MGNPELVLIYVEAVRLRINQFKWIFWQSFYSIILSHPVETLRKLIFDKSCLY